MTNPHYNCVLNIFVGSGVTATDWHNEQTDWKALLKRCGTTARTPETLDEFRALPRAAQTRIKDVGGFVGGRFAVEGRRRKSDLIARSVVTLDADECEDAGALWRAFTDAFSCAACVYSTHKHTPAAPRLRLVVPLLSEVGPEEYEAAARWIAAAVGIDNFDPTTFQGERLMFWPSTSKDGQFYFNWQDGPIMDGGELLERIKSKGHDWHNVQEWPMHPKEAPEYIQAGHSGKRAAAAPESKRGVIGAFCEAYTIPAAIEKFLPGVYTPTRQPNRYTFAGGSTFGGLVVYEDGHAFSNHATDPASGPHGLNAFDLCRIHLYGNEDGNAKPGTPANRLPSFLKMEALALNDPAVKRVLIKRRQKSVADDFAGVEVEAAAAQDEDDNDNCGAGGEDWQNALDCNRRGELLCTAPNMAALCLNDPELKRVCYDAFRDEDITLSEALRGPRGQRFDDEAAAAACVYLAKRYGLQTRPPRLFEGLQATARQRAINPVKDFITAQEWDGAARIDTALIDYLGADDTPLNRAFARKWFVAAVARVFTPGVKFDYVLTISGGQGIGKSAFFRTIAGAWFSDSFNFASDDKTKCEAVNAAWIVEVSELNGLKRVEVEAAKQFISKQSDIYRAAYARAAAERPRHCVFAATTNEEYFLPGSTGNRRWWVVRAKGRGHVSQWLDGLKAAVPQLWAEAFHYFQAGETLYLPPELEAAARVVQEQASVYAEDDLLPALADWLNQPLPADWDVKTRAERAAWFKYPPDPLAPRAVYRRKIVTAEVVRNECPDPLARRYSGQRINELLARCEGWKLSTSTAQTRPGRCYGRCRKFFVRIDDNEEVI